MSSTTKTVPYNSKEYWDKRFVEEDRFEWLLTWRDIQQYVQPYLPASNEPILHLGCGNSQLALDMADCGYKRILNVDYSSYVIEKMKKVTAARQQQQQQQLCSQRESTTFYDGLDWITADINDLTPIRSHDPHTYPVTIEKSLRDCIACGDDDRLSRQQVMAREIASVQPKGGYWLSISFSSDREPLPPYRLIEKVPIRVPQPNDKPGAPDIYYYLYILQCNKE